MLGASVDEALWAPERDWAAPRTGVSGHGRVVWGGQRTLLFSGLR
jgi:hypothetical protein